MIPNKTKASEYRVRTLDRNDLNEKGKIFIGQGGTTTVNTSNTSTVNKVVVSDVAAISKPDDDLNKSGYYALTLGGSANQDGIWGRFLHEVDCQITPTLFQLNEGAPSLHNPYKYVIRGGYKSLNIKKSIFDSTLTYIMDYNSNLSSFSSVDQKIFAKLSMRGFVEYDTPFEVYSSFVASQKTGSSWELYPLNFSPINITKLNDNYMRNFQSIVFCSNDTPWQETADGFQLNLHAIGMGNTLEEQKLYYQKNGIGEILTANLSNISQIRVTQMSIIF